MIRTQRSKTQNKRTNQNLNPQQQFEYSKFWLKTILRPEKANFCRLLKHIVRNTVLIALLLRKHT